MVGRSRNIIKGGGGGGGGARGGSHHEFMNANFAFHKSLNKNGGCTKCQKCYVSPISETECFDYILAS